MVAKKIHERFLALNRVSFRVLQIILNMRLKIFPLRKYCGT